MANKRDMELSKYGISKYRYRELYNFCLQYDEFLLKKQHCYTLRGTRNDGQPKANTISNQTAEAAELAIVLGKNIELIESTAKDACSDLFTYMLKAVSKGLSWDDLQPPCGKNQFYQKRRQFFYLLNKRKMAE